LLGARELELVDVPVRQVAAGERGEAGAEVEQGWEPEAEPPGRVVVPRGEGVAHGEEHERHRQVGDSAAEVAPTSSRGVGQADDRLAEHDTDPRLAGDEGGEADADEPAADDEARGVLHVHHAEDWEGGHQQAGRHSPPGANRVSDEPHDEAEEDGGAYARHASDRGFALRDAKSWLDVRHQRCGRKGGEEG